jgi:hypothetical protein
MDFYEELDPSDEVLWEICVSKYLSITMTKEQLYATCKNANLNWGCTCRYL